MSVRRFGLDIYLLVQLHEQVVSKCGAVADNGIAALSDGIHDGEHFPCGSFVVAQFFAAQLCKLDAFKKCFDAAAIEVNADKLPSCIGRDKLVRSACGDIHKVARKHVAALICRRYLSAAFAAYIKLVVGISRFSADDAVKLSHAHAAHADRQ